MLRKVGPAEVGGGREREEGSKGGPEGFQLSKGGEGERNGGCWMGVCRGARGLLKGRWLGVRGVLAGLQASPCICEHPAACGASFCPFYHWITLPEAAAHQK